MRSFHDLPTMASFRPGVYFCIEVEEDEGEVGEVGEENVGKVPKKCRTVPTGVQFLLKRSIPFNEAGTM